MEPSKVVVLIEDEIHQARALRKHIELALPEIEAVRLLPASSAQCSYESMESFALSSEGNETNIEGFIIVDLFLAEERVDPLSVFQQLMYCLFPSPTDFSLVCGRLGVLQKLIDKYRHAHFEIFSYFPTYFSQQNEKLPADEVFYKKFGRRDLTKFARSKKDALNGFIVEHGCGAPGEESAMTLMQMFALRDALYQRLDGIFRERISEHMTPTERWPKSIKSDAIDIDAKKLVKKIQTYFGSKK